MNACMACGHAATVVCGQSEVVKFIFFLHNSVGHCGFCLTTIVACCGFKVESASSPEVCQFETRQLV